MRFRQLAFSFRISKSRIAVIVIEVCQAIWKKLLMTHMAPPTTEDFINIAKTFWEKWQFPNCVGCLDLKHVRIRCPPKSGSMYYCHHSFYSIGLLTLTDANGKFIMVNIGSYGKENDAGVFAGCSLRQGIDTGDIRLPSEKDLPGTSTKVPFVILGDEAFPLLPYLMRPFPRSALEENDENSIFNYRLSRARMIVECSYGAIYSKFNLLGKAIETKVENAVHIVKAITLLHNIIKDLEVVAVETTQKAINPTSSATRKGTAQNATSKMAAGVRKKFAKYFKEHTLL